MTDKLTLETVDLKRILSNVLPHTADHRDATPVLAAVRLEQADGQLTATATDRYTIGTDTAPAEGSDTATLIDTIDVKRILRILTVPRGMTAWPVAIELDGTSTVTVTVDYAGDGVRCNPVDGEFPRYASLFPTDPTPNLTSVVGYNPQYLARFAKVTDPDSKHPAARFTITAADKPALVEIGATFRGLIMPVRQP